MDLLHIGANFRSGDGQHKTNSENSIEETKATHTAGNADPFTGFLRLLFVLLAGEIFNITHGASSLLKKQNVAQRTSCVYGARPCDFGSSALEVASVLARVLNEHVLLRASEFQTFKSHRATENEFGQFN